MAEISKECSVVNAFNFKKELQERIGHVTELKIGDKSFKADFTKGIRDPETEKEVNAVGVISSYYWAGGYAESMSFTFQVSITNKTEVADLLHTKLKSIAAEIAFNIYEYDPEKKQFFKCVHTGGKEVKCLLQLEGDERVLYLSDEPGMEVQQPMNFQVNLGLVPEDEQQDIQVALSTSKKFTLPWGVERKR